MSDWANHAAQMADKISSVYLTIAAPGAENENQGLWNRAKMSKFIKSYYGSSYTVCVREQFEPEIYFDRRHIAREAQLLPQSSESTLRKGAWCLQEELVPTRVVHFTRREVVFIYLEGIICESMSLWENLFKLIRLSNERSIS